MASYKTQPAKDEIYKNTKLAINECLKQFSEFSNAINEVCNRATMFGRCLQSLEDVVVPAIIGSEQVIAPPKKYNSSSHLSDSLDTFNKIMISFSDKIKTEAFDSFDNFIVQVVLPSNEEVQGVINHNSIIVDEFRESFFSMYNNFLMLAAELMENFLLCNDCSSPIGSPHQPNCLTDAMSPSAIWKKTKFDDKFITFGMNFNFDDIVTGYRKNILSRLSKTCEKQSKLHGHQKISLPLANNWPKRWIRGGKSKNKNKPKPVNTHSSFVHPSLMKATAWTPRSSDQFLKSPNSEFTSFAYHPDDNTN